MCEKDQLQKIQSFDQLLHSIQDYEHHFHTFQSFCNQSLHFIHSLEGEYFTNLLLLLPNSEQSSSSTTSTSTTSTTSTSLTSLTSSTSSTSSSSSTSSTTTSTSKTTSIHSLSDTILSPLLQAWESQLKIVHANLKECTPYTIPDCLSAQFTYLQERSIVADLLTKFLHIGKRYNHYRMDYDLLNARITQCKQKSNDCKELLHSIANFLSSHPTMKLIVSDIPCNYGFLMTISRLYFPIHFSFQ